MISEYAVDPACVKQIDALLRVLGGIGVEHGRVIAEFPNRWPKKVLEVAKRIGVPFVAYQTLSRRLELVKKAIVATGRQYDDESAWFTNASTCRPEFRAVVSTESTGHPRLIGLGADLDESEHWRVTRGRRVPRNARELAAAAAPLLCHAQEIVFVDLHFDPRADRFGKSLVAFLQAAQRTGKRITRCEYHLKAKTSDESFMEGLRDGLGPFLPRSSSVTFVRWKQKQLPLGDDMHERHVLTEFGGLDYNVGLDVGTEGETTPVSLLPSELWADSWSRYRIDGTVFERAGAPIRVAVSSDGTVSVEALGSAPLGTGNARPPT